METVQKTLKVDRPDYVPAELVVDFDLYNLPGAKQDLHAGYLHFQKGYPDIFWTPFNGGHWVATRAEDIILVQSDNVRFSSRRVAVPKAPDDAPQMIPLESDPPAHADLRRPVVKALLPNMVDAMENKVRELAVSLIESFFDRGECDFIGEFCQVLPVIVFLDMVDLPREKRYELLPLVDAATRGFPVERRVQAQLELGAKLAAVVHERRQQPGNDLISQVASIDVVGERISEADAIIYCSLLLQAGLDTVVTMLAMIARFLATHDAHRRQLAERLHDKIFMRNAVEEFIRINGIATGAREIAADFEYKGLKFRKGDMILPPPIYAGFDEACVADPFTVDFSRQFPIPHATFSTGPHTCPGAMLARREVLIFLQEWLARIPDYKIKPGTTPTFATGMVNTVLSLELSW